MRARARIAVASFKSSPVDLTWWVEDPRKFRVVGFSGNIVDYSCALVEERTAGRAMEYRRFVLVVDDERMIADSLVIILQRNNFAAAACYSADDAVSILSTVAPDILISDVVMGNRSGVEVAIVTRELFPECQIVLLSGNAATAGLLDEARQAGHNFTCLAKPIHPTELLAQLKDNVGAKVLEFRVA